jgi:hypothetical protein
MPTVQEMIDLGSTKAVLDYASANLGVRKKIKNFEQLNGTLVKITLCMEADNSVTFQGVGNSKIEAAAVAISDQFPA